MIARDNAALRRTLLLPVPLVLSFVAGPSEATPAAPRGGHEGVRLSHPLHELVERERGPRMWKSTVLGSARLTGAALRPPPLLESDSTLDCLHAAHDISLDPETGVTTATLALRVRAVNAELGTVGFSMDEGLEIGTVTASDRSAAAGQAVFGPTRVVHVELSPVLAPGDETVITIPYSGTLSCSPSDAGTIVCSKDANFSYFAHQSIFPFIFDPASPASMSFDGLTRDIVLRVPSDIDVVVTGEKSSEVIEGDRKISSWTIDKPLSRIVGMYALVGKLGLKEVEGRPSPTTLVFPIPEKPIDRELVSWSTPALDFIERVSGTVLPFERSLSLVRLPQSLGDPGTATFGMTLLSDSYAQNGDLMYEETWAHENAHLFWGIVVPEADPRESRLMSEGMATLTELDYTFARHFSHEDRDLYLARRFLPMGLDIRAHESPMPPVQLGPHAATPDDFRTSRYTLWAYYKTAATLDHLRVTVGEETFSSALTSYVRRCSFEGCRPDALRESLENATSKDMQPFFDRWITGTAFPRVLVGFTPASGGAWVELTKDDELPMTLELWLELEGGGRLKQRVDLEGRTSRVRVETPRPVLGVSANPRHDLLVDVRSAVEGDVDFDGETDGFDVLRCARLVGRSYTSSGAIGLWNAEESFDTRCDVNSDLRIDHEDLAALARHFGTLRER